ncbi:type I-C CRISPR-associated protein Cas7/Csd2 [Streptomyces lunaelactis]|uniref:Type I-C CRISPR-associated protein Cas7/Csd2 n=1 Tax=Streptomyces lunaelactis TaxID=1535768 RepID=A0A2R4SW58_9ACTN|nr:type I-C CRISPR-associated protein Cas7/Csd2 [Streptomyces lunaelactis]AVZ71105.1 type I-C CRISPR-associated protein Cas7/Csd2 [Streptomyces lunaelactis]NUK22775.1 type I-C CRISPR-associated protein Cas7/Csd2 [Streptomyces lunaelactis]NUK85018.1 type I-C CRISPR-associated protein Cas7/Csd2 [Streptomyces lunaelactis]
MTNPHLDPTKKHDFAFLFDVRDGNPNGDPDAGGMPRTDSVTGQGLVTDVALKRKIRNTVTLLKEGTPGYEIYVESGVALNAQHERAYHEGGAATETDARTWMCSNFYDVRMFGAVMTTGKEAKKGEGRKTAGRVQGPMQLTFSRTIDPVLVQEIAITRVTPTTQADVDKGKATEMGNKHIVPYGLYLGTGHFSAPLATRTGVTEADLETFWRAFTLMFEHDRASARGELTLRGLYVFTHDDAYGKAPAHQLLDRIHIKATGTSAVRTFDEYQVDIPDDNDLPDGITLTKVIG